MTERAPVTREAPLRKDEREQLVGRLVEHTAAVGSNLVFGPNWPSLEPYLELIGMMGVLQGDESLQPAEQAHLRKMIALQTGFVNGGTRTSGAREFRAEVLKEAGTEVEKAQSFPDDLSTLPRPWNNALSDVIRLQHTINPLSSET